MSTPRPHELGIYFASRDLETDGAQLPQRVVTAGGELKKIACASLGDPAAYWNGAVGWFYGDTLTEELRGRFFHVRSFVGGELLLSKQLPVVPEVGDKFRLWCGGGRASATETFGLLVADKQPEMFPIRPTNVTGVEIVKASPGLLGYTNPLYLYYQNAAKTLYIRMNNTNNGPTLDVSQNVTGGVLYLDNEEGYIVVNVVTASLPTYDRSDSWNLSYPKGTFIPDMEGYETSAGPFPKYRYHPVVLRNNGDDMMINLSVMAERPWALTATLTSSNSNNDYGRIYCNNLNNWPAASFWVRNRNRNDVRYIRFRSGNELVMAQNNSGWNLRGVNNVQSWYNNEVIEIMSDVDVGIETPNEQNAFASPIDKYTAPDGVAFMSADDPETALDAGDLEPGGIRIVWLRETVMAGHRVRKDVVGNLRVLWS